MIFINLFKMMLLILSMINLMMVNSFFLMSCQIIIVFNEMFMNLTKNLMFILDKFSMIFFMIISIVVYNVLSFMNIYMHKNDSMKTFLMMTKMFILSMMLLVYSFNLWTMILGWEGLGVSSFYLIFYYNNMDSWKSAMKTLINNKLGDCMLLTSMIYMYLNFYSMKTMMFFFLLALMTKSAQYPFMAWLPMAMSAPTPISAMVHSSTLVTAGLFIILRLMNNFLTKMNLNMFMNLCLLSMFISSFKATMEKDMKKMIALSTLSQIGLIFFFMLNNMKFMAFMYMCNHALFKSLLFINMGYMMMNNYSNQFKFNMNNFNLSPLFMLSYKISCFNLMNLSFFSSFFIKEKMMVLISDSMFGMMKIFMFLINSFLTMNYSLKMIFFFNYMNFKMKNLSLSMKKNYKFMFFLTNTITIFFSKTFNSMILMNSTTNMIMVITYLLSIMLNFKIYKNKFLSVSFMMYLNFMIYLFPFSMMKLNFDMSELWMEKISLNFYFFLKNKMINKTFNMNFNMILMMFMMIMFI